MASESRRTSLSWLKISSGRAWILVGLAILFVIVVRVRLREMPLERDEGEYAYAGQLILQGIPPYKEAYNMKLPGTYAAYALIMALFGQSPSGIHLGVMLVNVACVVLVFLLGRRILDEVAGVAAAVVFALLSLSPSVLGLAGHATHFVTLFALAGILVLLQCRTNRFAALFTCGLLFGLAFLMKQHGVFFGVFGAGYLLWTRLEQWLAERSAAPAPAVAPAPRLNAIQMKKQAQEPGGESPESTVHSPQSTVGGSEWAACSTHPASSIAILKDLSIYASGYALPYLLTCLVLWGAGVFPQFVFWTISYAGKYASSIPLVGGEELLRIGLRMAVGPNLIFWVLPWAGALFMWWDGRLSVKRRLLMTALLLCSIASVSVGLFFRTHYFIPLLPALALLTGMAISRSLFVLRHERTLELFLAVPVLILFVAALGSSVIGDGALWFGASPPEAVRTIYGTTIFSDAMKVAGDLKSRSAKDARIAVLGSEPEIYFCSRRHSATGYIYMYPLMETHPYALRMQEEMIGEIERAQPEWVVFVDDNLSWLLKPGSEDRIHNWWKDYSTSHFDLIATVLIQEDKPAEGGIFETPQAPEMPPLPRNLLVFKRKAAPASAPASAERAP